MSIYLIFRFFPVDSTPWSQRFSFQEIQNEEIKENRAYLTGVYAEVLIEQKKQQSGNNNFWEKVKVGFWMNWLVGGEGSAGVKEAQLKFASSKSVRETLEKGVKYAQS